MTVISNPSSSARPLLTRARSVPGRGRAGIAGSVMSNCLSEMALAAHPDPPLTRLLGEFNQRFAWLAQP
jgi:hypothetical protein